MDKNILKKLKDVIVKSGLFDHIFYGNINKLKGSTFDCLIEHYIRNETARNLQPNPIFDPAYYRSQSIQKFKHFENSLVDYILFGRYYGVEPCPAFDSNYVSNEYNIHKIDALKYYLERASQGLFIKPNFYFDPSYYLESNLDIRSSIVDPYFHFINWGANEGRLPQKGFSWSRLRSNLGDFSKNCDAFIALVSLPPSSGAITRKQAGPSRLLSEIKAIHRTDRYEPLRKPLHKESRIPVDVFAFYLTQFHRTPENDQWWGPGFTEWNNVVRGLPRFHGHYQPRVPADLGFYDLANLDTLRSQVELAKAGGLTGFGFYYYNFGGKRLLEKPLNLFLENKDLDLKFFYIWANETWSKRWDGSENEILIEQKYPESIVKELVSDATYAFQDERYYRINSRPIYVIYRPSAIPDFKCFVATLRAEFSAAGQNPWIYMAQSFNDMDPVLHELDGAMEFPPHKYTNTIPTYNPKTLYTDSTSLRVYEYDDIVNFAKSLPSESFPLIRTCFPSWDNDARKQGDSVVVNSSTPEKFKDWLDVIIKETQSRPHHPQVICINAWNEWGEGAYLEPDRHFGHAYLNALQSVLYSQHQYKYRKMLLVGHDAFPSGAQRLLLRIGETLQKYLGTEVAFMLLRADKGYDGFLNTYRAVANTIVVDLQDKELVAEKLNALKKVGYRHALVNTAVASKINPLLTKGWKTIQLIHELEGMLYATDDDGLLKTNLLAADKVVAPTVGIYKLLENKYEIPQNKLLKRPQGLYRNIQPVDKAENVAYWQKTIGLKRLPKIIVGLGYADRRKGADIFVTVCKHLSDAHEEFCFIWQGDWDQALKSEINHVIQELTEKKRLFLAPFNDNVEGLLDLADAYFLPSREDPLPTVAFEAWAFGKPVVAIDGTGGIADLIAENPQLGSLIEYPPKIRSCAKVIVNSVTAKNKESEQQRIDWVTDHCGWSDYVYDLRKYLFEDPVIDIRIVAHNHAKFIDRRVGSLLDQTVPARSIQYVDIGSSQDTVKNVGEKLSGLIERVKVRFEETNHGKLYKTWLQLVKESDAEFFHIAEGDDSVTPDFLEKLSKALIEHPDAAFAFAAVKWVDEVGNTINDELADYVTKTLAIKGYKGGFLSSERLLRSGLMIANPILSMSSVLWRSEALIKGLEEAIKDFEKMTFAYDWILYVVCCNEIGGSVFIQECLVNHTQHKKSMSSQSKKNHMFEIKICHEIFKNKINVTSELQNLQMKYLSSL